MIRRSAIDILTDSVIVECVICDLRRALMPPKRMRRSHNALDVVGTTKCTECGAVIKPHRVCKACGNYKGKKVVEKKEVAE